MATIFAMIPGARKVTGETSAEPKLGVEAGQHSEGHPRLWDRLPRSVDLRNLDQMIHQGNPVEADGIRGQCDIDQPFRRSLPQGKRDTCRITRGRRAGPCSPSIRPCRAASLPR